MKKMYCFLVCLLVSHFIVAQSVDPKLAEAFQNALDSMHQELNIKGLGAAIQLPNNAVWAGGSGISTSSPLDEIGPEHRFASGSTTKTITAACILQLVDEGLISLDDSLYLWIPGVEHLNPDITIRQLLRHQSGLYDVLQNPDFNTLMSQNINQIWTFEEVIAAFLEAPVFEAGSNWAYSNTNYILLGLIIEAVTGKTYHQEIKDRFFSPLGLDSYSNPAFDPLPNPAAHLWLDITGDGALDDAFNFLTSRKSIFSAVGPAGGYFVKPADLAKWIRASMSGSLFQAATWAEATTTVATTFPGNTRYGLGLSTRAYLGWEAYGHGGDLGGYTTQAYYFPEKDISIVVNGNDASINSWFLSNTVNALLQVYIDCEGTISNTGEVHLSATSISVSPNPFSERIKVTINFPAPSNDLFFTLTDMLGQEVWSSVPQKVAAGNNIFNLDNFHALPTGIYFLNGHWNGGMAKPIKLVKD